MSTLLIDLHHAARRLARDRGFTTIAILTLGLGLALCVGVLAVARAYLLRSLPYPAADRLYSVTYSAPGEEQPRQMESLDWPTLDDIIEHRIAWDLDVFYLLGGSHPEPAPGAWVTPGFASGLGISPSLGRGFVADDFRPGAPQVALISHRLWTSRYHADESVLGGGFSAYVSDRPEEAESFTIVGVLPDGFWHLNSYTDVLVPLRAPTYPYLVGLRRGVSRQAAAARITALVSAGAVAVPEGFVAELISTHQRYTERVRPVLAVIAAVAALVLLMACANMAVLLLLRSSRRQHEVEVRRALGAGRLQIARMYALEGLLLGTASTLVALLACRLSLDSLGPSVERQLGRRVPGGVSAFALDGAVIAAAVGCGLLATAAFVLPPLLDVWRRGRSTAPRGGARIGGERGAERTRSLLIAVEVAASLALLFASALMVDSALRMLRVDFGIETQGRWSAGLSLRQQSYPDPDSRTAFFERLLVELEAAGQPGLALVDWWPLQPPHRRNLEWQGTGGSSRGQSGVTAVSPAYFSTLGIPVLDGRSFTRADRTGSQPVVILSDTVARRLWPDERAVGRSLVISDRDVEEEMEASGPRTEHLVVGVAGDIRQTHDDEDLADLYLPLLQQSRRFSFLLANRPRQGAEWVEDAYRAVAAIDTEVSLGSPRLLQSALDEQRSGPRFLATLLATFAAFAALLALVGLYGVIAYAVRQREHEVAVRMAIGADDRSVVKLFLSRGAWVLAGGLVAGAGGALLLGRLLESQLFRVEPGDPRILTFAIALVALSGLAAVYWPARRAAMTDPAEALRGE